MKRVPHPQTNTKVSLQDVIDRIEVNPDLSEVRKRDLRSAVVTFVKLSEKAPTTVPLDLAVIRATLDGMVPAQARSRASAGLTCAAILPPPSMPADCSRC